jgi:hypothetical protein
MRKRWGQHRTKDPARTVLTKWGPPLAPFPKPNPKPRVQLRRGQAKSLRARVKTTPVTLPKLAFLIGDSECG